MGMLDQIKAASCPAKAPEPVGNSFLGWIERKELQTPTVLFLEMHRPLLPLAWSAAMLVGGILAPFVGPDYYEKIKKLRDPKLIDKMIDRLEKSPRGCDTS